MSWQAKVKQRFSADVSGGYWDELYDDPKTLQDHSFIRRRDHAVELVTRMLPRDAAILDLGCGSGPVLTSLFEQGYRPMGLDYSENMLAQARRRLDAAGGYAIRLMQGQSEALPFPDHSFDFVICLGVISYLEDYAPALAEIRRVLKPGGCTIITFRSSLNLLVFDPVAIAKATVKRVLTLVGLRPEDPAGPKYVGRFLDPFEVMRDVEAGDLPIVEKNGIGFGPPRWNRRPIGGDPLAIWLSDCICRRFGLVSRPFFWWAADVGMLTCVKESH